MVEPARTELSVGRFDRWAPWYDRSALQGLLYRPVHEAVLRCARRSGCDPRRILDIGCGTGRMVCRFARCFPDAAVIGVDASLAMAGQAHAAAAASRQTTTVIQSRAECLPFADAVFDLVVVTLSVRHWNDPDAGLAEIGRVMSRGGWLVLADVFDTPSHQRRLPPRLRHRSVLGVPKRLRSAIASAGLTVARTEPVAPAGPIPPATIVAARRQISTLG